jgi:hypothetical protein
MSLMEEARAEIQGYLIGNPKSTPERHEKKSPWKDPKVTETFIEAYRELRS